MGAEEEEGEEEGEGIDKGENLQLHQSRCRTATL